MNKCIHCFVAISALEKLSKSCTDNFRNSLRYMALKVEVPSNYGVPQAIGNRNWK